MSIRDHLQTIYDQRGALTPQMVVDVARPEDHPLHMSFDWDDATAGEAWRREQARKLIGSVKIAYRPASGKKPERLGRAYHSVPGEGSFAYRSAGDIAADPALRAVVLAEMEREWKALRARYEGFAEFSAMVLSDMVGEAA